ncbi:O-antigen/teichoic acid export membrane protein [Kerstersia gyiorum]|uniref:lipopolysaccharide biosynthesis protein n=1 Tax=Kerstersia gyiorum TaxID=206506 RepID=UPI00209D96E7|nr:hypothetical protein [Kerstersia gyiorum]MCP1714066.1 O-antigen/teichoic acid export membrane protein [Kerstersia gyiorum]
MSAAQSDYCQIVLYKNGMFMRLSRQRLLQTAIKKYSKYLKYGSRFLPAAGAFFLTAILVKVLDPEQAGLFFVALASTQLVSMAALFGANVYFLREYAADHEQARATHRMLFIKLWIFIVGAALSASAYALTETHGQAYLYLIIGSAPFMAAMVLNSAVMRAQGSVLVAGLLGHGIVSFGILVCMPMVFYLVGVSLDVLCGLHFILAIFFYLVSELVVYQGQHQAPVVKLSQVSEGTWWEGFCQSFFYKKTWRFGFMAVVVYLTQWLPIFLLQRHSLESVAVMSLAYRYASILSFLGVTIDLAFAPMFAKMGTRGGGLELQVIFRKIIRVLVPVATVFFVGMTAFVYVSDVFYLQGKYAGLLPVALIVFFSSSVLFALAPFTNLLLMSGLERSCNNASIVCFAFVLLATVVGLDVIGSDYWVAIYMVAVYAVGKISASTYSVYVAKKHLLNAEIV